MYLNHCHGQNHTAYNSSEINITAAAFTKNNFLHNI